MKLWMAALGGESFYEDDMPACCRRGARGSGDSFECLSCGARWQAGGAVESEECAFTERITPEERKGAA